MPYLLQRRGAPLLQLDVRRVQKRKDAEGAETPGTTPGPESPETPPGLESPETPPGLESPKTPPGLKKPDSPKTPGGAPPSIVPTVSSKGETEPASSLKATSAPTKAVASSDNASSAAVTSQPIARESSAPSSDSATPTTLTSQQRPTSSSATNAAISVTTDSTPTMTSIVSSSNIAQVDSTNTVPTRPQASSAASISASSAADMGSSASKPPEKVQPQKHSAMPLWAEGLLIALAGLGFLALVIFGIFYLRRRRRRNKATLDFSRINDEVSISSMNDRDSFPRLPPPASVAQTSMTSSPPTLFGADRNHQPVTMSSTRSHQRHVPIETPMASANPFAVPPLNKAYDVLRGRPRSTTLTDRGSWIENPFKDPESERFDPFGTLRDKAREERRQYAEQMKQKRYDEKYGNGLSKKSDVTVGGMGVLDRTGANQFPT